MTSEKYKFSEDDVVRGMSIRDVGPNMGHARGLAQRMKRLGFNVPHMPFWVQYYKKYERKFKQQDADAIALAKGGRPERRLKPTTSPDEPKKKQPIIDQEGDKRRRIQPVKPVPHPPPAPLPDMGGHPRRRHGAGVNLKTGKAKYRDLSLDDDYMGLGNARRLNGTRDYKFSIDLALHLAKISGMSYMATPTLVPEIRGYDDVTFIGSDAYFASAQGLAMYDSKEDKIVIAVRGSDTVDTDKFINLGMVYYVVEYLAKFYTNKAQFVSKAINIYNFIQLFRANIDKAIADGFTNIRTDFTRDGALEVHKGWSAYVDELEPDVAAFIAKHDTGNTSFVFTGHSLGTTCELLKYRLVSKGMLQNRNVVSYTFGGPSWCHKTSVGAFNEACPNTFKVFNSGDFALQLFPEIMGYRNVGKAYMLEASNFSSFSYEAYKIDDPINYLSNLYSLLSTNLEAHGIASYMRNLEGAEALTTDLGISRQQPQDMLSKVSTVVDDEEREYTNTGKYFVDTDNEKYTPHFYMGNLHLQHIPQEYILGFYLYDSETTQEGLVAFK